MLSRRLIGPLGVLILFLGLSNAAHAQSDQIIYGDSLGTGWQDWSWCARDLGSTDVIHSGSRSVKVTYTAAYQGFYLRHTAFDSSLYAALTFWINGGGSVAVPSMCRLSTRRLRRLARWLLGRR